MRHEGRDSRRTVDQPLTEEAVDGGRRRRQGFTASLPRGRTGPRAMIDARVSRLGAAPEACRPAARRAAPAHGAVWSRLVAAASRCGGAGADYAFSLDDGPPRPDPRSAFQPAGVDGPSRLIDHDAFAWTDGGWRGMSLSGAVLYELHIGTFSVAGTFDGAIEHLDHLVELGIDVIELMPVAEFSGRRGWGYDGVDLFAPHHGYGGPEGLKRLIDACHARGLSVVMDVVYNHLGPAGNYLAEFGPYFSDRHRTNWGAAVNFDGPGSDEVRRFVIDNALMWLRDYHCDGLRLDAVHAIVDESAMHVLEALAGEVDALSAQLRRPLSLDRRKRPERPAARPQSRRGRLRPRRGLGGRLAPCTARGTRPGRATGTMRTSAPWRSSPRRCVRRGCMTASGRRIAGGVHGRAPLGMSGRQFVVSTQNHDQVGNRAAGERRRALMSEGRLRVAAALLLTSPFVPMLFQGEEWGASSPVPVLHRPRRPGARSRRERGTAAASSPDSDGAPRAFRTLRIRRPSSDRSSIGPKSRAIPTRASFPGIGSSSLCDAGSLLSPTPGSTASTRGATRKAY